MTYTKINDLLLHNQAIAGELEAALKRVLMSGRYALGPEVESFESSFAAWCGAAYCRGVASGTDALELALRALDVEAGTEVITAANAGMYSSTAILAIGAKPVYADIDPATYTIDPKQVEALVTPKTRVIIATHLYGRIADMPALVTLAERHKLSVLEDCAQAHGAILQGKKAGTWGDAAAFSFYPTKNLGALGDGGAVVTNRRDIHERVTQLRQYGWESKYKVVRRGGRNSRLDEIQAALLNVKLKHLQDWTEKRRLVANLYCEHIKHPAVSVAPFVNERHVYHLFVVRCSERDELRAHLANKQIATDIHYPYLDYQHPVFKEDVDMKYYSLPHSERAAREILSIPCYPELTVQDTAFVIDAINSWSP